MIKNKVITFCETCIHNYDTCVRTYVHTYDVLYRMHCVYLCMRMYVRDFVHIKAESVQTYVRVCCTVHAYVHALF